MNPNFVTEWMNDLRKPLSPLDVSEPQLSISKIKIVDLLLESRLELGHTIDKRAREVAGTWKMFSAS